ncbi:hypothetical protein GCM10007887_40700 [Methylobacterium haplocladii]|nr:hypothetical protein GCM10007887_40700 [Methylobacterium haplocladii]
MRKGETTFNQLGAVEYAAPEASSFDVRTALMAPGEVFSQPRDVLAHPILSYEEKRAILASWASDSHAVESCPTLRCLPGSRAELVPVGLVLAALAELDADNEASLVRHPAVKPQAQRRPLPLWNVRRAFRPRRRDDDDDPPPCPAAAMPRPRPPAPITGAVAVPA